MKTKNLILAIRPKTLTAGISPVLIGTFFAMKLHSFHLWVFILTLSFSLLIQIGTNLANDYFDFFKGADSPKRKGPIRVTQAGLIEPKKMLRWIFYTFLTAAIFSFPLILRGGVWIATLMLISVALGIFYTAGPYALAYLGLGDLFAFLFFGPIACGITTYLQTLEFNPTAFYLGIGPGLISTAILIINNLRDFEEDGRANKKTLTVRFGKKFSKYEYFLCLALAIVWPALFLNTWFASILIIPAVVLFRKVIHEEKLNWVLQKTGQLLFLYSLLFFL